MIFRDLTADDIECRVQSVKANGLVLLLYKNARVDMSILDETVGAENWQREHYECKGSLFCRVGIRVCHIDNNIESREWIWKADCGTESNTEPQKGASSDSFKRACTNIGIGRELYTAPFIWIPIEKCHINDGKCYDKFVVEKVVIKDKRITAISILNASIKGDKKAQRCFVWQEKKDAADGEN